MLKIRVKLLIIFLIILSFLGIAELSELRDDNEQATDYCGYSIDKLHKAALVSKILSKIISRKINVLTKIEEKRKFLMESLQNYQENLKSGSPIVNKIYMKIVTNEKDSPYEYNKYEENANKQASSNEGKMYSDNSLKPSNKEMKDSATNTLKFPPCPFGQLYINGKGCIFTTETQETIEPNSFKGDPYGSSVNTKLSESENLKLDKLFFPEEKKKMENINHEQLIDDLVTGNENFNHGYHIFFNKPKYEMYQGKLKSKSKDIEDFSQSIHHSNYFNKNNFDKSETFPDISLKSPFIRVEEPKSKQVSLKFIDFTNAFKNRFDSEIINQNENSEIPDHKYFNQWTQNQFEEKFPSSNGFTKIKNEQNRFMEYPSDTRSHRRMGDTNLEVVQGVDGKNLVFEFYEPYKLIKNYRKSNEIKNKFAYDKNSNINFHPSEIVKDVDLEHDYNNHWYPDMQIGKTNSAKNYFENINQGMIFKGPKTVNYEETNPFHRLMYFKVPGVRTDMIDRNSKSLNSNKFIGYENLSGNEFLYNKNRIQSAGVEPLNQKNNRFSPLKPIDSSIDDNTYKSKIWNNIQASMQGSNIKNQGEFNSVPNMNWIPSTREPYFDNYEKMSLQKENEELKKLLSKTYLNREMKLDMPNQAFDNSFHKPYFYSGNKFSLPMQEPIMTSSSLPRKHTQSEFLKAKESDDKLMKTVNSKYLELLNKVVELSKQGQAKELDDFSHNLPELAETTSFSSKPMTSNYNPESETFKMYDEGELTDDSIGMKTANPTMNSFQKATASEKLTRNAGFNSLNSTKIESLPVENVNANKFKGTSISNNENMKNRDGVKHFNQATPRKEQNVQVDDKIKSNNLMGMDKSMDISGRKVSNGISKSITTNDSRNKDSSIIGSTAHSTTTSSHSDKTSEQSNFAKKLLNNVENISTNGVSKIQNGVPTLADFDDSTIEFPKQSSEDVDALLKVNKPTYNFKSVGIPIVNDEGEVNLQKSSNVDGLASIAGGLF